MRRDRLARLESASASRDDARPKAPEAVPLWRRPPGFPAPDGDLAESHLEVHLREFTGKVVEMTEAIQILDAYLAAGRVRTASNATAAMVGLVQLEPAVIGGRMREERLPFLEEDPAMYSPQRVDIDSRRVVA